MDNEKILKSTRGAGEKAHWCWGWDGAQGSHQQPSSEEIMKGCLSVLSEAHFKCRALYSNESSLKCESKINTFLDMQGLWKTTSQALLQKHNYFLFFFSIEKLFSFSLGTWYNEVSCNPKMVLIINSWLILSLLHHTFLQPQTVLYYIPNII